MGVRTISWTLRRLFMYSFEDRLRAIELYFKYGRKAAVVIRELGYPTVRHLRRWIRAWQTAGEKIECVSRKLNRPGDPGD
ncbi:hypothetical protein A6J66_001180 [Yersinia enterocolitica]|nr:hypothetical protein A6J66_001180 [Yersinia enterocolitica]